MRQNIFKTMSLILMLTVILSSCEKWIDTDININPNNPGDVTVDLLLPATQGALAYTYGGDLTRYQAMWMQHLSGVERQSFALERYSHIDSDINNLWNTLYGGALINLKVMVEKAEETGARHYMGMGKVLKAFALMNISSVWGDVPYSDAFKGTEGVLKAKYDSQQQIYETINTLLDEALVHFGEQNDPLAMVPGNSDLIYKGNMTKWEKAARSLKVRAALHLSKRNGLGPVRDLINAGGLISDASEDFQFNFGAPANENNPVFQFQDQRGDIRVGKRIADMLIATEDPRTPEIMALNEEGEYIGSGPGEALTTASLIGPGYASVNSPVFFLTYFEVKFMEAEAFYGVDDNKAATAYNDAVKASLAKHDVSDEDWEASNASEDAGSITLQKIMEGKYVAMFHSLETWTDWRRTGFPTLQLPENSVYPQTLRRFLYPLDENLYNTENVPAHTPTSRVWWDDGK
ncbi:MAG: SusD/RagB family nutrient-binding outer membrane lipoprotein [Bacteroidales bacterium]